jgi:hypothetical protein
LYEQFLRQTLLRIAFILRRTAFACFHRHTKEEISEVLGQFPMTIFHLMNKYEEIGTDRQSNRTKTLKVITEKQRYRLKAFVSLENLAFSR